MLEGFTLKCADLIPGRARVGHFLTDGHQEFLQVSRHLTLDALLQSLLSHALVLHQSYKNT